MFALEECLVEALLLDEAGGLPAVGLDKVAPTVRGQEREQRLSESVLLIMM